LESTNAIFSNAQLLSCPHQNEAYICEIKDYLEVIFLATVYYYNLKLATTTKSIITPPARQIRCMKVCIVVRLLTHRIVDRRDPEYHIILRSDLDRIPISNLPGMIGMAILWRANDPILFLDQIGLDDNDLQL
jgi:hypothetical protein